MGMARPQVPASPALSHSQQPWAPDPPSGPPLTAVASLGKGHGAGFVAAGTAVGLGRAVRPRGGVGGPLRGSSRSWATPQDHPARPSNAVLRQEASLSPACFPAHPSPGHGGRQSRREGAKEGLAAGGGQHEGAGSAGVSAPSGQWGRRV